MRTYRFSMHPRTHGTKSRTTDEETLSRIIQNSNSKMWDLRKRLLSDSDQKEIQALLLRIDNALDESYHFFNKQIAELKNKSNQRKLANYYERYTLTLERMLSDPFHAQNIFEEFKKDATLSELSISIKKQATVNLVIENVFAVTTTICALALFASLITLSMSPAIVTMGLAMFAVLGLSVSLYSVYKVDDKLPGKDLDLSCKKACEGIDLLARYAASTESDLKEERHATI